MIAVAAVVLPVFLVVAAGYLAASSGWLGPEAVDGLMRFAQGVAVPVLLFRAISTVDPGMLLDLRLLVSFYAGALCAFAAGIAGARLIFARPWEDAVAIGFVGLFSNALLLGLPITERAYGAGALTGNFAIIAFHSPFCYAVGITVMEIVRARGTAPAAIPGKVLRTMTGNAIIMGIAAGFALNLSGLTLPAPVASSLDLIARAAIPTALFALGGILLRYRPEGDLRTILFIVAISLVLHPALVRSFGELLALPRDGLRSAVITASVAPGVNASLFADLYGRARRVAASAVLIGTAATLLSATFWILVLP
jgi:predicted permease